MKRRILVVVLAATVVVPLSVSAFAGDLDEPVSQDREQRERAGAPGDDALAAEVRFAKKLRLAVMSELQLNEKQLDKITELFEEHNELVERLAASAPAPQDKQERREQRERLRELERKAAAAREAGDREKAREYLRDIRDLRRGKGGRDVGRLASANRKLIGAITELLDEEQVPPFRRLVRKARADTEKRGALRLFMRGVRTTLAEMDFDKEQRKQVGGIVRKAMREVNLADDDPAARGKMLELLRTRLTDKFDEGLADAFVAKLGETWKRLQAKNRKAEDQKDEREESPETQPATESDDAD